MAQQLHNFTQGQFEGTSAEVQIIAPNMIVSLSLDVTLLRPEAEQGLILTQLQTNEDGQLWRALDRLTHPGSSDDKGKALLTP